MGLHPQPHQISLLHQAPISVKKNRISDFEKNKVMNYLRAGKFLLGIIPRGLLDDTSNMRTKSTLSLNNNNNNNNNNKTLTICQ